MLSRIRYGSAICRRPCVSDDGPWFNLKMSQINTRTEGAQTKSVAIVVRHADLMPEAMQTALHFRSAAHAVSVYLLEPAVAGLDLDTGPLGDQLSGLVSCCCCNHQPTVERLGLTYSDFAAMAEGLEAAHWVLTY